MFSSVSGPISNGSPSSPVQRIIHVPSPMVFAASRTFHSHIGPFRGTGHREVRARKLATPPVAGPPLEATAAWTPAAGPSSRRRVHPSLPRGRRSGSPPRLSLTGCAGSRVHGLGTPGRKVPSGHEMAGGRSPFPPPRWTCPWGLPTCEPRGRTAPSRSGSRTAGSGPPRRRTDHRGWRPTAECPRRSP